jgi:hypothetical protein
LITSINPDEPEADADRRLQSFMQVALPRLTDYLPPADAPPITSAVLQPSDSRS